MAYPSTANNLSSSHAALQTITSADVNAIAVDVDQLTVKVGTGASTPTAGTVLAGTGVGTSAWQSTPTSTLTVTPKSISYTLTSADDVITATGGAGGITITLHSASTATKKPYYLKKVDSGAGVITIAGVVDGVTNPTLSLQYDAIILIPDGTVWLSF